MPPRLVRADRAALVQVLDNLVSNAVKYSPAGGQIALRVAITPTGSRVRFSVLDTGPGLTREDQEKIFSEFAPLSRRPDGAGALIWVGIVDRQASDGSDGRRGRLRARSTRRRRAFLCYPAAGRLAIFRVQTKPKAFRHRR